MHSYLSLEDKSSLLYHKLKERDNISFKETIDFLIDSRESLEEGISLGKKTYGEKGILLDYNHFSETAETSSSEELEQEIYLIPSLREYLAVGRFVGINPIKIDSKKINSGEVINYVDSLRLADLVSKYFKSKLTGLKFSDFYKNNL